MLKHPIKIRLFHPVRKNRSLKIARPPCKIPADKTKTPSSLPRHVKTLARKSRLFAKLLRFFGKAICAIKRPVTRSFPVSQIRKMIVLLAAIPVRCPGIHFRNDPGNLPRKFQIKDHGTADPPGGSGRQKS